MYTRTFLAFETNKKQRLYKIQFAINRGKIYMFVSIQTPCLPSYFRLFTLRDSHILPSIQNGTCSVHSHARQFMKETHSTRQIAKANQSNLQISPLAMLQFPVHLTRLNATLSVLQRWIPLRRTRFQPSPDCSLSLYM